MFELPPDLPPPLPAPRYILEYCINSAAKKYQIHPLVIEAITVVEGGHVGTVSKNTNGTYDLGIMQINTINIENVQREYPNYRFEDIAFSPCGNIMSGTYLLSQHFKKTKDIWKAVGNYHSKTPKYHNRYLAKAKAAYRKLLKEYRREQANAASKRRSTRRYQSR